MADNREDLIRSLAGVMGMSGEAKKKDSHFDPSTGTLYCGSRVFSQSDIAEACLIHDDGGERCKQDRYGDPDDRREKLWRQKDLQEVAHYLLPPTGMEAAAFVLAAISSWAVLTTSF